MQSNGSTCIKCVDGKLTCSFCNDYVVKNGRNSVGNQRYKCKRCNYTRVWEYRYKSYQSAINSQIVLHTIEGCGIRSIARILNISPTTVISRILKISADLKRPYPIVKGNCYEVDELFTYVGHKKNRICYSLEPKSGAIIDVVVGRRNKTILRKVTETLVLSDAKRITTDKLNSYKDLIPTEIHSTKLRGINHIERKNLTLRTHLKRLNRRTIAYSKSMAMLLAVVRIYFWC